MCIQIPGMKLMSSKRLVARVCVCEGCVCVKVVRVCVCVKVVHVCPCVQVACV